MGQYDNNRETPRRKTTKGTFRNYYTGTQKRQLLHCRRSSGIVGRTPSNRASTIKGWNLKGKETFRGMAYLQRLDKGRGNIMIITIAAQKGGVSKTSSAAAISQALAYKEKNTLLIDTDAQKSASLIYGTDEDGTGGTYSLITGQAAAEDLIQEKQAGKIIPASPLLDRLDIELNNKPGRDFFLKAGIEHIKEK